MIRRVFIQNTSEGEPKTFNATGFSDEDTYVDRPLFQQTGFASLPKEDSEGIIVKQGNAIYLIATQDPQDGRPVLSDAGDVCIYTDSDNYIKISSDGSVEVKTDSKEIKLENGNGIIQLKSNGKVSINGGKLTVEAGT